MIKKITLTAAILGFCVSSALAQIDTSITKAFESLKLKHGSNWQIQINEKTGIPSSIHFGKTKPKQGKPEDIAKEFLKDQRRLFKMKAQLGDLKIKRVQTADLENKISHHVQFDQYVENVPVYGATFLVHLHDDGSIEYGQW